MNAQVFFVENIAQTIRMEVTFDSLCSALITSITTFYTNFEKRKAMFDASDRIQEYMAKKGFVNVACTIVKDVVSDIEVLKNMPNLKKNSIEVLNLLRCTDKLNMYMKGNFEALWKMEKEDCVNIGEKYPGLSV